MSETVPLPRATQSLSPKDAICRTAICPLHNKRTNVATGFIGPAEGHISGIEVWLFNCVALTQKGHKADHTFAALADRTAPKTVEESKAWVAKMKMSRLAKPSKSQS